MSSRQLKTNKHGSTTNKTADNSAGREESNKSNQWINEFEFVFGTKTTKKRVEFNKNIKNNIRKIKNIIWITPTNKH